MKTLLFISLFFTISAKAHFRCLFTSVYGNKVKFTWQDSLVTISSKSAERDLIFTEIDSTWDNHANGIVTGKIKGPNNYNQIFALKYENHFGVIKKATLFSDVKAGKHEVGHYEAMTAEACTMFSSNNFISTSAISKIRMHGDQSIMIQDAKKKAMNNAKLLCNTNELELIGSWITTCKESLFCKAEAKFKCVEDPTPSHCPASWYC